MTPDLVPSRQGHAGWTVERQLQFLIALAETGSVTQAARQAGMTARAAYHLRMRAGHEGFREGWMAAIGQAYLNLQSIAFDRAINGTTRQIWKDGELVAEQTAPSDRLLMWLIDRCDPRKNINPFLENLTDIAPYLEDMPLDPDQPKPTSPRPNTAPAEAPSLHECEN